jgi:hypothetical protein
MQRSPRNLTIQPVQRWNMPMHGKGLTITVIVDLCSCSREAVREGKTI